MRLSELGERRVIELLAEVLGECGAAELGIGDDAAVLRLKDTRVVVSCDLVRESTHMPREMTPEQAGSYAVNVNLSDLAAMGAKPVALLFSLGLPADREEEYVRRLARGIRHACDAHGVCVAGGDTKEAGEVIISGFALGMAEGGYLTRSGAKPGEVLCITGELGSAAAGFYCLTRGIEHPEREEFLRAALEPRAKVREGMALLGYASACIDVSDGLAWSLHELARRSGAGFEVYEERLPRSRGIAEVAALAGVPEEELLFHKGGDFELLFSVSQEALPALKEEFKRRGLAQVTEIGRVVEKGGWLITEGGERRRLPARGYEAFKSRF
ncbi:MAG: thiamine-phosphate kinase [Euryarchaeota archaeon]|nr:thiamine-phosphate kinase [Euryarchaeota archaeon]